MKRFGLIAVILSVLLLTCLVATACGDSDTTTPKGTDSATSTAPTTTAPTTNSDETNPDETNPDETTPEETTPDETNPPITLSVPEQYAEDEGAVWVQRHMPTTIGSRTGADGKEYEWCFYFTIKAEGGHFKSDPDTNESGLAFTTPDCIYIGKVTDESTGTADTYTKYDITYWETREWWEIWCVADGFVPEDGVPYDIYLFFRTDENENHSNYPDTLLYIWDFEQPFVWEKPAEVVSEYGDIEEMIPDIDQRTQLLYHDTFLIDDTGRLKFTFKSDGDPFANGGDNPGVSFTMFGDLYINGERVEIVPDSYETEEHYIIYMTIQDYEFVSGEEYEFVISIDSNDPSGTYCNNPTGYFIFYNYVAP